MNATPCPDCQKSIDEPQACEVCGKVTCTDCACYGENDDRVWCIPCVDAALDAQGTPMSEPGAGEVLELLAEWLEAERDEPSGPITAPMSARLEDASGEVLTLDPSHLRTLAAALSAPASPAPTAAAEAQADEWANIPSDVVRIVTLLGPVSWGQTPPQSAADHAAWVSESVQLTAETFGQGEAPQPMSMLFTEVPESDEQLVIGYIGTSPNSPTIAGALAGAWNLLHSHCVPLAEAESQLPTSGPADG